MAYASRPTGPSRTMRGAGARRHALAVVVTALLAALLALAGTPARAHAQPTEQPDESAAASLTLHKYSLPSDIDAGEAATGAELPYSQMPPGATPLEGIEFSISRAYTLADMQTLVLQGAAQPQDFAPLEGVVEGGEGYVEYVGEDPLLARTGEDGTVTFDLTGKLGTWLVIEGPDPRVSVPCDPFLVSVPMPDPNDENAWLYDVHVYPKNYITEIDKAIVEDGQEKDTVSSGTGEANVFRITSDIPADIWYDTVYQITDQLDWRISTTEPTPEAMSVTAGGVPLVAGEDFDVSVTQVQDEAGHPCQLVTWDFSKGLEKLSEILYAQWDEQGTAKGCDVVIEFTARLNENATAGVLSNHADLTIVNESDETYQTRTPDVYVLFAGIDLDKRDAQDMQTPLAGATFRIATSLENARDGVWMSRTSPDGTDAGVWEETTDENGRLQFVGLPIDLDAEATYYYLVEVVAPDAYALLEEPIPVSVGGGLIRAQEGEDGFTRVQVLNSKLTELPATGGTGTRMMVIGGAFVICLAALVAIGALARLSRDARRR